VSVPLHGPALAVWKGENDRNMSFGLLLIVCLEAGSVLLLSSCLCVWVCVCVCGGVN
jgi:hypothetical protein